MLLIIVTLSNSMISVAQNDSTEEIIGKWKLSKLSVDATFVLFDYHNKELMVNQKLSNMREQKTDFSEDDSLKSIYEIELIYQLFDSVSLEFKKDGTFESFTLDHRDRIILETGTYTINLINGVIEQYFPYGSFINNYRLKGNFLELERVTASLAVLYIYEKR